MFSILAIEKEDKWRRFFSGALGNSYNIYFYPNGKDIFEALTWNHFDLIILNLQAPERDPFDLLSWIKMTLPNTPVIITSDTEKAEFIVKVIKQGAFHFLVKPFSGPKIEHVIEKALENRSLKNEINYLRHEQDIIYDFDRIVAFSPVMKEIIETLKKFSKTDSTILMTGDTGTGKSFLAGTIHFNSPRRTRPFIAINCANIPETLLESELFGHEKGAFTGADKQRIGRFEQARGGTLFLDEIGEISLSLQAKLLRVLEGKSFERLGGNKTIHSDVRVIVATNRNLSRQIEAGKFREDLYYRINILSVMLPPLRERRECIEPLSYWLLEKICRNIKKNISGFSQPGMVWIKSYEWPGNIRQLANTIERAVILEEGTVVQEKNLSIIGAAVSGKRHLESNLTESLKLGEKEIILKALEDCLWIQKDAATLLGLSPRTLNYKIKKFGITHNRWRKNR
ncbi:MAG TPA: sigma-54 dependent transcriptional regulator [Desulfobacteraceae bacterium]|nr:sigma-54 dependent transcriptional regulator [Desulfobacteraceae bacterium]HPJ67692.1 sigma-54 dependent transcriptional regulator [Desulfobacteraceae bacterium]HPQ29736.1 sigma-54 dependent transcriptional regulator [Desulfobacteraceae bacterium]